MTPLSIRTFFIYVLTFFNILSLGLSTSLTSEGMIDGNVETNTLK